MTEAMDRDVASFVALTEEAVGVVGLPDLVVWPETMVPGFGFDPVSRGQLAEAGPGFTYLSQSLQVEQLAAWPDRPMLVGSSTNGTVGCDRFPRVLDRSRPAIQQQCWRRSQSGAAIRQRWCRRRSVNGMPYLEHWPWLEQQLMATGAGGMKFNLDASDVVTTIDVPPGSRSVTSICFEDTPWLGPSNGLRRSVHR